MRSLNMSRRWMQGKLGTSCITPNRSLTQRFHLSIRTIVLVTWEAVKILAWTVRPRRNVELFVRQTKLTVSNSWKVRPPAKFKFVWMSLNLPTRSIRLLQTDKTSEDHLPDNRRSSQTKLTESNSWKVRPPAKFKFVWMSLNLPTRSIRLL